jgi:uncharacterized membrane protein YidH (DUF202 family)
MRKPMHFIVAAICIDLFGIEIVQIQQQGHSQQGFWLVLITLILGCLVALSANILRISRKLKRRTELSSATKNLKINL